MLSFTIHHTRTNTNHQGEHKEPTAEPSRAVLFRLMFSFGRSSENAKASTIHVPVECRCKIVEKKEEGYGDSEVGEGVENECNSSNDYRRRSGTIYGPHMLLTSCQHSHQLIQRVRQLIVQGFHITTESGQNPSNRSYGQW